MNDIQPTPASGLKALLLCAVLAWAIPASAQPAGPTPNATTSPPHVAIALDAAAADRYAGYYRVGPHRAVRFWREGDHFYFGAVGTPQRTETFPATPTLFFFANAAVTFTFNVNANGRVTSLTVNQAGREIVAPRIAADVAASLASPGTAAAARGSVRRTWSVMSGITPVNITLPTVGTIDYWPCFSPDGKTVLFSRSLDGGKTWALLRVRATGGAAAVPLATLPVSATRASWSAKSGLIAFNGDARGGTNTGIWVIDGDGHHARALATRGILAPSYPSWYPDGKTIGFGDAARNVLYRMDIDGGAPVAITQQNKVLAGMSSVSPDGRWVAFAGQKSAGQVYDQADNQIWLADGEGVSKLLEAAPAQGRTPSWSPDGQRLAFESNRGSATGLLAIFLVNRDGTGLVQVTDYSLNASHPVFSPDGRRLVFATGDAAGKAANIAVVRLR